MCVALCCSARRGSCGKKWNTERARSLRITADISGRRFEVRLTEARDRDNADNKGSRGARRYTALSAGLINKLARTQFFRPSHAQPGTDSHLIYRRFSRREGTPLSLSDFIRLELIAQCFITKGVDKSPCKRSQMHFHALRTTFRAGPLSSNRHYEIAVEASRNRARLAPLLCDLLGEYAAGQFISSRKRLDEFVITASWPARRIKR